MLKVSKFKNQTRLIPDMHKAILKKAKTGPFLHTQVGHLSEPTTG